MTSTALEPETQIWPDMDIACEGFVGDPCDRPAEWIMWRGCCADKLKYKLQCTEHKDEIMTTQDALVCQFCGIGWAPARHMVRYIEPLK